MTIQYRLEPELGVEEFRQVLLESTLAERRPAEDPRRLERMLRGADVIVTARDEQGIVGVARSISDGAWCCYLSDLAVSRRVQGRGVGRELIEQTRRAVGPEVCVLLLAAPRAVSFYEHIGMPRAREAFLHHRER